MNNLSNPLTKRVSHHGRQRRGITLLFVVSMIVLFLLMGTTFVVISNDYLSAARKRGRLNLKRDSGAVLLQRAFYDFVRGPSLNNPTSPLRGHSLLGDQYGYGFSGYVSTAAADTRSNQLFELTLQDDAAATNVNSVIPVLGGGITTLDEITNPADPTLPIEQHFTGQVLTFVSGPAAGTSTRIIEHRVDAPATPGDPSTHTFVIMADASDATDLAAVVANLTVGAGSRVLVNGRAFSGFGAGFNTASVGAPISADAFRPNWRSLEDYPNTTIYNNYADGFAALYASVANSVNESYDAPDYQNMFLAATGDVNGDGVVNAADIIASFHRTELGAVAANAAELENRFSFRPVYQDIVDNATLAPGADGLPDPWSTCNANFPNAATPFANRPLDVDNDYDGILDSIWMDLGYPIHTDASGRVIKPMVAAMIVDMDGKFNINAHGNRVDNDAANFMTRLQLLGNPPVASIPKGLGMGPADISLRELFPSTGGDYGALLTGSGTLNGRYGADDLPGAAGRDNWSRVGLNAYPDSNLGNTPNLNNTYVGGIFSSPMDIHGRFGYGNYNELDATYGVPVGLPMADIDTSTWGVSDIVDSPYEVDLLHTTKTFNDELISPQELERLLRPYDRDAYMLPDRLQQLLGADADAARRIVTTDSFEVPRTPMIRHTALIAGDTRYVFKSVAQVLQEQLVLAGVVDPAVRRTLTKSLLAPEVILGMPMNINRMFGDGIDNDGDGVYDEHWDSTDAAVNESDVENATYIDSTGAVSTAIGMDHNNDGTANGGDDYLSRQNFARHLFVLTWLTIGEQVGATTQVGIPDINNDGNNDNDDLDALAQWCVNVVDFRDADAIMTPFEYDRNPFDATGWDVDGSLTTDEFALSGVDRGVVFGAERPELLMTEAFSAHNRATDNLPPGGPGPFHDSEMVPNPMCFIELFAPQYRIPNSLGDDNAQRFPREIYEADGTIDLGRSASTTDSIPIWRMVFTREQGDSPMATDPAAPDSRRVYFVEPSTTVAQPVEDPGLNENYFYPDATIRGNYRTVAPNGYALVGSSGIEYSPGANRIYRTVFSRRTDATVDHTNHSNTNLNLTNTRQIRLIPGVGIEFQDGDAATSISRDCVAIPINRCGNLSFPNRSFGISDPDEGYEDYFDALGIPMEEFNPDGTAGNGDGDGYIFGTTAAPQVQIVAADRTTMHTPEVQTDGTHFVSGSSGRWVQLQRLANPQAPYDPMTNPYVTVDEMPISLTVYNGNETGTEPPIGTTERRFAAIERGERDNINPVAANLRRLLWRPELDFEAPSMNDPGVVIPNHNFDDQMFASFGEMNTTHRDSALFADVAFPEFAWNDRPFVSNYELGLVPWGSGQHPQNLTTGTTQRNDTNTPMGALEMLQRFTLPGDTAPLVPAHLLPFGDITNNRLSKLFEFVEVPSRFMGTEMYLNPTPFSGDGDVTKMTFNPPYNSISRYRVPGKVNINTIQDERVWNGVMSDVYVDPALGIEYLELFTSRQGGGGSISDFDNPFRPESSDVFVPAGVDANNDATTDAEATLLREKAADDRLVQYEGTASFNDSRRNTSQAQAPLTRMGNLVTDRSSVYAIWITVGYFEVDENGLVGAEIGSDTGEIVRHRGFWIYDRSIPVGFEPGNNHNVDRGILVQSISE